MIEPAELEDDGMPSYILSDPAELATAPPFSTLFSIRKEELDSIADSMQKDGYDLTKAPPIVIWKERNVILDGHTRREAAIAVRLPDVPICFRECPDEDSALEFAISCQKNRRNITDADIYRYVQALDKRGNKGRPLKEKASLEAFSGKSSAHTAEVVGTSKTKVDKVRIIEDHAPEDIKKAVSDGKMSINMAYREAKQRRKREAEAPKPEPPPAAAEPRDPYERVTWKVAPTPTPSEEDEWLASFPIRSKVVAGRFDADARAYRYLAPKLTEIQAGLGSLLGCPDEARIGTVQRAMNRRLDLPSPSQWTVCKDCHGTGKDSAGPCKPCRGGGYRIPGFRA